MYKVISSQESKEAGIWDIESTTTGEVVATIKTRWGFRNISKKLVVQDKEICTIKNQDEAIVKLIEFFAENQKETEYWQNNLRELNKNLEAVEGHYTKNLILKAIKEVESKITQLMKYQLN